MKNFSCFIGGTPTKTYRTFETIAALCKRQWVSLWPGVRIREPGTAEKSDSRWRDTAMAGCVRLMKLLFIKPVGMPHLLLFGQAKNPLNSRVW
jgi:hypothetical protein